MRSKLLKWTLRVFLCLCALCLLLWLAVFHVATDYWLPGGCNTVKFAQPWQYSQDYPDERFVYRITDEAAPRLLITKEASLGGRESGFNNPYVLSDQKYVTELLIHKSVRLAFQQEWEAGRPVEPERGEVNIDSLEQPTVRFRGKNYGRLGRRWSPPPFSYSSPNRSKIALKSFTGFYGLNPLSELSDHGMFFLEAYNADSGRRLFTVWGFGFYVFVQSVFDIGTGWITDNLFAVAFRDYPQQLTFCSVE